jgi:hypothetical protein
MESWYEYRKDENEVRFSKKIGLRGKCVTGASANELVNQRSFQPAVAEPSAVSDPFACAAGIHTELFLLMRCDALKYRQREFNAR